LNVSNDGAATGGAQAPSSPSYSVPNLERGMAIMELLARHPGGLTLMELAGKLGYPQNSIFRITSSLTKLGYLHRIETTRRFVLTRKLLAIGFAAVHEYNIVEKALEVMRQFRDEIKETVALATLLPKEGRGLVLAQVYSSYPFGYRIEEGTRFELHACAPGKAMLAFLPQPDLTEILGRMSFCPFVANTITDRGAFLGELAWIREAGYALDREEVINGCHCVAAPVFSEHGYPIAAIWATGPSNRLTAELFEPAGRLVIDYAARITERLSHQV
jgi:IclR family transcriptional regulator, acetate operon repressor